LAVGIVAYLLTTGIYESQSRGFWFDELNTVIASQAGDLRVIHGVLLSGADSTPIAFHALLKVARIFASDEHVAYRLPSILAFATLPLVLFRVARRLVSAPAAVIAALVPMLTVLNHRFSVEARGYAIAVSAVALAAYFWQKADSRAHVVGLALSLAFANATHYTAGLVIVPLGIAELGRTWSTRWRVGVWIAFAVALVPIAAGWAHLTHLRAYYGGAFWAATSAGLASTTYDYLLMTSRSGVALGLSLALSGIVVVLALRQWKEPTRRAASWTLMMVAGLVWLPIIAVVVGGITGTGMTERYSVTAIVGLAVAVAIAVDSAGARACRVTLIVIVCAVGFREAHFWWQHHADGGTPGRAATALEKIVEGTPNATLPVVVSSGLDFLPIEYYAHGELRARTVALVEPAAAREYAGSDSVDLTLLALRQWRQLPVFEWRQFIRRHQTFLLYSGHTRWDWLRSFLIDRGAVVSLVRADRSHELFLVTAVTSGGPD
jgi:hypothetical protein